MQQRRPSQPLRAYAEAKETDINLEAQMATAIERLLEAASKQDWDVAMVYDAYRTWLDEED